MKNGKRLCYEKTGRMRFVGHLDMLRVIQRALSRAHVGLVFSQGFNPHPQMSFAQPLSLGVTGIHEYMELELAAPMDNDTLIEALNEQLPAGLCFHECKDLPQGMKTAMATSDYALYRIELPELSKIDYAAALESFLQLDQIFIRKISKSHGRKIEVDLDVKPMIRSMKLTGSREIELWCVCNSAMSLKPDRMMKCFWNHLELPDAIGTEAICRIDLYHMDPDTNELISLMDLIPKEEV